MGVAVGQEAHKGKLCDCVVDALHQNIKGVRAEVGKQEQCNTQVCDRQTNQQNNQFLN